MIGPLDGSAAHPGDRPNILKSLNKKQKRKFHFRKRGNQKVSARQTPFLLPTWIDTSRQKRSWCFRSLQCRAFDSAQTCDSSAFHSGYIRQLVPVTFSLLFYTLIQSPFYLHLVSTYLEELKKIHYYCAATTSTFSCFIFFFFFYTFYLWLVERQVFSRNLKRMSSLSLICRCTSKLLDSGSFYRTRHTRKKALEKKSLFSSTLTGYVVPLRNWAAAAVGPRL